MFFPENLSGEDNYLPCFTFDYSINFTRLQDTSWTLKTVKVKHHLKFHTNFFAYQMSKDKPSFS